jgi:hypothetical protein
VQRRQVIDRTAATLAATRAVLKEQPTQSPVAEADAVPAPARGADVERPIARFEEHDRVQRHQVINLAAAHAVLKEPPAQSPSGGGGGGYQRGGIGCPQRHEEIGSELPAGGAGEVGRRYFPPHWVYLANDRHYFVCL